MKEIMVCCAKCETPLYWYEVEAVEDYKNHVLLENIKCPVHGAEWKTN